MFETLITKTTRFSGHFFSQGFQSKMDRSKVGELMVITGNSHPELAELIAK